MASGNIPQINPFLKNIPIVTNANLNNLEVAGVYNCPDSATASSLSNCPTTVGFAMLVLQKGDLYYTQLILGSSAMWIRTKTSGGWQPWYRLSGTQV